MLSRQTRKIISLTPDRFLGHVRITADYCTPDFWNTFNRLSSPITYSSNYQHRLHAGLQFQFSLSMSLIIIIILQLQG